MVVQVGKLMLVYYPFNTVPFAVQICHYLLLYCLLINKQLLDEVEHDIMNYQGRGLCYLLKPKAEADNTDTRV